MIEKNLKDLEGKINEIREWNDLKHETGFYVSESSSIGADYESHHMRTMEDDNKMCWPNKEMAEAQLAMSQLAWWMRQPEYNGEDQSVWCNWKSERIKYVILILLIINIRAPIAISI